MTSLPSRSMACLRALHVLIMESEGLCTVVLVHWGSKLVVSFTVIFESVLDLSSLYNLTELTRITISMALLFLLAIVTLLSTIAPSSSHFMLGLQDQILN